MDYYLAHMIFAKKFYRKPKDKARRLSRLQQDYMSSLLRSQLTTLQNLLSSVENADGCDAWYFKESIRRLGKNVYCLKKACSN